MERGIGHPVLQAAGDDLLLAEDEVDHFLFLPGRRSILGESGQRHLLARVLEADEFLVRTVLGVREREAVGVLVARVVEHLLEVGHLPALVDAVERADVPLPHQAVEGLIPTECRHSIGRHDVGALMRGGEDAHALSEEPAGLVRDRGFAHTVVTGTRGLVGGLRPLDPATHGDDVRLLVQPVRRYGEHLGGHFAVAAERVLLRLQGEEQPAVLDSCDRPVMAFLQGKNQHDGPSLCGFPT